MNRDMSTNEVFHLRLEKTYYERGFFNVTRDFDHFVRSDDGPISLQLGDGWSIEGHVNRRAQRNGMARPGSWVAHVYATGSSKTTQRAIRCRSRLSHLAC